MVWHDRAECGDRVPPATPRPSGRDSRRGCPWVGWCGCCCRAWNGLLGGVGVGGGGGSVAAGDGRQALRAHDVEIAGADLGHPGEHGVEIVVYGEVPAREWVAVSGREPQDELDRSPWVRSSA